MPQVLKSARDGKIDLKDFYTAGDIAFMQGIAKATAIRLIDSGEIRGIRLLTGSRPRRVTHGALIAFVRSHPNFRYMLDKLNGYDPRVDFPVDTEPPPPERPMGPAVPWGPEHPRSARRGQIPRADAYSTKEVAFLLGVSRRTVIAKLDARVIRGLKVPCTRSRLTTMKWKVMHGAFIAFVRQNPHFGYALERIQGCEQSSEAWASRAGAANAEHSESMAQHKGTPRKEPLVAPGAPGWRGHPPQTRRGGFKRGPKLADGRQPSKSSADVDADSLADHG